MQQKQVAAFHQVSSSATATTSFTSKSSSSNTYLFKNNGVLTGGNQQRFAFSTVNDGQAEKPAFKGVGVNF
jgi:hypothetical protein